MKTFNFNKPVLKLSGEPMEVIEASGQVAKNQDGTVKVYKLNEALATNLSLYTKSVTEVEVFKFAEWARILYSKGIIKLDQADEKLFRSFVDSLLKTGQLSVVFMEQLYQAMEGKLEISENGAKVATKGNHNEYT